MDTPLLEAIFQVVLGGFPSIFSGHFDRQSLMNSPRRREW
jgi:hypothetical protein